MSQHSHYHSAPPSHSINIHQPPPWSCLCHPTRRFSFTQMVLSHRFDLARLYQRFPELDSFNAQELTYKKLLAALLCLPPNAEIALSQPKPTLTNSFTASVIVSPSITISFEGNTRDQTMNGALLHAILAVLDPDAPVSDRVRRSIASFMFPPRPSLPSDPSSLFYAPSPVGNGKVMEYADLYRFLKPDLDLLRGLRLDPESFPPHHTIFSVSLSLALLNIPQPHLEFEKRSTHRGSDPVWHARATTSRVCVVVWGTKLDSTRKMALLMLLAMAVQGNQPSNFNDWSFNSRFSFPLKNLEATLSSITESRLMSCPSSPRNPGNMAPPYGYPVAVSPIRQDSGSPVFPPGNYDASNHSDFQSPSFQDSRNSPSSYYSTRHSLDNHYSNPPHPFNRIASASSPHKYVRTDNGYNLEYRETDNHLYNIQTPMQRDLRLHSNSMRSHLSTQSKPLDTYYTDEPFSIANFAVAADQYSGYVPPRTATAYSSPIEPQRSITQPHGAAERSDVVALSAMLEHCQYRVRKYEQFCDRVIENRNRFVCDLPSLLEGSIKKQLVEFDERVGLHTPAFFLKIQNHFDVLECKITDLDRKVNGIYHVVNELKNFVQGKFLTT